MRGSASPISGAVCNLFYSNIGENVFRMGFGVQDAWERAPGMRNQHDLVSMKPLPETQDQGVEIGDVLIDIFVGRLRAERIQRLASVALVPIYDDEAILQSSVVETKERRLADSRPTVDLNDQRICDIAPAQDHGLLDAV